MDVQPVAACGLQSARNPITHGAESPCLRRAKCALAASSLLRCLPGFDSWWQSDRASLARPLEGGLIDGDLVLLAFREDGLLLPRAFENMCSRHGHIAIQFIFQMDLGSGREVRTWKLPRWKLSRFCPGLPGLEIWGCAG
jgi:hypothetical protein